MPKVKDLTDRRFGRLVVIRQAGHIGNKVAWLCQCDCNNFKIVTGSNLTTNQVTSCGCLHSEIAKQRLTTHGQTKTKIYKIWESMKRRCSSPKAERYSNYGGRGICVCEEWKSFEQFYIWALASGYREGLSIERKDVDGNYEPSNCCWVTQKQQGYNKTTSHFLTFEGQTMTVAEWSEKTGIPYEVLYQRVTKLGWSAERALGTAS